MHACEVLHVQCIETCRCVVFLYNLQLPFYKFFTQWWKWTSTETYIHVEHLGKIQQSSEEGNERIVKNKTALPL